MKQLDISDFLLLAEAASGIPAQSLEHPHVISRAESALAAPFATFDGVEFYEGLVTKAAVLCSRIVRNHPLPDGNKRTAYLCMIELIRRNGAEWAPVQDDDARVQAIEALAAGDVSEEQFAVWLRQHVRE